MKIIYMHHAEREIDNSISKQEQDITKRGIEEAKNIAERLKKRNDIRAIYSSTYKRCIHTSELINKYLNVPIILESRFNEMNKDETKKEFIMRNIHALDDLNDKYGQDDTIICVTSGVNLTAFICYFYDIKVTDNITLCQGFSISPINFVNNGSMLD